MRHCRLLPLLVFWLFSLPLRAEDLTIAVAANFSHAMAALVAGFETESGHRVQVATGSSGKLYAQIKQGAPFVAFFSADQAKPAALLAEGLAKPGSDFTYALGGLALWSNRPGFAGVELERLQSGEYRKLALANPRLAPYGLAAQQVLSNLGIAAKGRMVLGENIAQTYQFVSTGNADLGFVARSQLTSREPAAAYWPVPAELHEPIRQNAVLLARGSFDQQQAAQAFFAFVRSDKGRMIVKEQGYDVPDREQGL